jgi:hypothetical protein
MTTQFVHSNNQSLLWKVINNTQQTINYFANAPPGEKEKWFQAIIGHVYNQYNGQNISLRDINKRAIDFMLQSLQTTSVNAPSASAHPSVPYQSAASAHPSVPYQSAASAHPSSVPYQSTASAHPSAPYQSAALAHPYQTVKSREQQLTDQFTRRQAEYESMVKKDVPTPHFTENVKDEAIQDLGSAVKEYMKQRDQDIEIPKSADSPTNASLMPLRSAPSVHLRSAPKVPLKLNLNNTEPISFTVDELPLKKVQWGENIEHIFDKNESIILPIDKNESSIIARMEKDISEMKTKLEEILALLQK